jgi:Glu-tRNA(Gln) amidotransferase subunit E-like FAD-binding protein
LVAAIEIGQRAKGLKRAGIPVERLGEEEWIQVFDLYTGGHIPREAIPAVATKMAQERLDARAACKALDIALQARELWGRTLQDVTLDGYLGRRPADASKQLRFLVGKAVRMLKGKAPAKEVAELIHTGAKERTTS